MLACGDSRVAGGVKVISCSTETTTGGMSSVCNAAINVSCLT
jgi:hypothetical protein